MLLYILGIAVVNLALGFALAAYAEHVRACAIGSASAMPNPAVASAVPPASAAGPASAAPTNDAAAADQPEPAEVQTAEVAAPQSEPSQPEPAATAAAEPEPVEPEAVPSEPAEVQAAEVPPAEAPAEPYPGAPEAAEPEAIEYGASESEAPASEVAYEGESPQETAELQYGATEADESAAAAADFGALAAEVTAESPAGDVTYPATAEAPAKSSSTPAAPEVSTATAASQQESEPQTAGEASLPGEILGRADVDTWLAGWQKENTQGKRTLCLGLVDLDRFSAINERHGRQIGDAILRLIAQIVEGQCSREGKVSRIEGQQFVVFLPDVEIGAAANVMEYVRQAVEVSHFHYRNSDIRLTVSCGIVQATADDTSEGLYGRLDLVLKEAKRYGRNNTFAQEGEYPTPIAPPGLALPERHIVL